MKIGEPFQNDIKHTKKKLYGVSLSSIASTNMLFAFFHLYAVDLGSTPFTQSIITSQSQLGNTVLQPYFGARSDQNGRKPYLMLGFGALAVTNFLIFLFQLRGWMTVSVLLVILAFQTILGSAWIPAWTAYLGDITTKKIRGRFVGKVTAAGTIFSVGVILAVGRIMDLIESAQIDQYIILFGVATVLLGLACIFAWGLPETLRRSYHQERPSLRTLLRENPTFRKFTTINACAMFAMSMTWPLNSFVYRDVVNVTATQVVLISSAYTLTVAIAQRWGGSLADKIGRRPWLIIGRLFLGVYPVGIALSKTWTSILVAELFSGMGGGLVMTLTSVLILDLTKGENERGKFTAAHNFIIGIVTFVGAIVTGSITQILAGSMGEIPAVLFMLYIAAGVRFITAFLFFKIPETLESTG